ncbi:DNA-directed RNA polymerase V subunit 5A-like [Magnolia sinica]|uniref:DNA-directed RNA polymerase V subunit 5A-like n=1 Tax=Magnolia sinica TaxID=86752 RepID=UPI00265A2643|nr:DNA-directed RNA polymerase V subunit 5A-like [Magnolia sinica]XP_058105630.1 DNA-directed RNA polymerase V subunit 5A-like [Magnolia sinica]XP_058105631.1 DNA-directed RNA polymerase V subunit 5A-like [Magnolia sinica]
MDGENCICSYVDEGSVESHRYYLARRTVLEMLRDRGYTISDSDISLTLPEFRSIHGQRPDLERLRISTTLISNPSKKILVIFCGTDVVKLGIVRGILSQVSHDNLSRMILVLQNKMTAQARQATKELFPYKVELFQITDLLMNITKHVLKPKHEILTPEEKQKLLSKYNVEEKQLPRILEADAVATYYGLEPGQVVKVTYDSEVTGLHVTYRCVM